MQKTLSQCQVLGVQNVGVIVTTLFSPGALSGCVSPTGLAETVHCDLQPVDAKVTYITSQVSKGCVAQVPNATLEVHVLFLESSRVSAWWQGWGWGPRERSRAIKMKGASLVAVPGAAACVLTRAPARRETRASHRAGKGWHSWGQHHGGLLDATSPR